MNQEWTTYRTTDQLVFIKTSCYGMHCANSMAGLPYTALCRLTEAGAMYKHPGRIAQFLPGQL